MHAFNELENVMDALLGPQGCGWDRAQTLLSMRDSLLEETCETIEAIDLGESAHIQEELGDLLFNAAFLCKLAEKEGHGSFQSIIKEIADKLIRRHPHVFGDAQVSGVNGVLEQWEKIKSTEKSKGQRTSTLDGIAKGLPALARAQKVLKKLQKKTPHMDQLDCLKQADSKEDKLGQQLLKMVEECQVQNVNAEEALRKTLAHVEKEFRRKEQM